MSQALDLPRGVHIVAQAGMLSAIDGIRDNLAAIECGLEEDLPLAMLRSASIVVIEVDPASRNSLERVDRLCSELPGVPVIAGLAKVDIATSRQLLRRGVCDIVALPFTIDELVTSVADAASRIGPCPDSAHAPVVAMLRTIGGTGATTVATHLAARMVRDMGDGHRACVIDLDLQSGDVSAYLGCTPRRTISDLLEAGDRLDDELFESVACTSHAQVDVIAAPADIVPIESIDFDALSRVLAMARRHYDIVLLDLPASLTNWSLSAIYGADLTILVGTLTIPSLRHAQRQLNFLVTMGIPRKSIQIVLNRVENRLFKTIGTNDAAEALHHPILATISEDGALLRTAQDQGELADAIQRRSKFAKEIGHLADQVAELLAEGG